MEKTIDLLGKKCPYCRGSKLAETFPKPEILKQTVECRACGAILPRYIESGDDL